jgi:hypothetical protein
MADDERPPRRFEYQTDRVPMTDVECRVLAVLPMILTGRQWPTVVDICERVDVHPGGVRSCLVRLQDRYLVEKDKVGQTFGRTPRGTFALEREVDRPSDYTRFGPSDEAGQPCMGQCGRLAPAPDGAAGQGWLYNEDEHGFGWALVCPDCKTKPEMVARLDACRFQRDDGWRDDPNT